MKGIYLNAICGGTKKAFDLKMYVGDEEVYSGTLEYNGGVMYISSALLSSPIEGKVKIVIDNPTALQGASDNKVSLKLNSVAFDY